MLVPLSWLKEYVDLNLPLAELEQRLTLGGLEVEGRQIIGDWWSPELLIVGRTMAVSPHPNADKLVLVSVDLGDGAPETVVTGAPNLVEFRNRETPPSLKIPFAKTGAQLKEVGRDKSGSLVTVKPATIRGVPSRGMVCSEAELGISDDHGGVLILPNDVPTGTPLVQYLSDQILELGLTPDMARCLSIIGVAREVAALTGSALRLPGDSIVEQGDDRAEDAFGVEILAPDLCPRYLGFLLRGVQLGPSPRWMQDRLRKTGVRPISNIVDITNYVMMEYGQPLHAFDYDRLVDRARRAGAGKPVISVRRARPGESMRTLDGIERKLDSEVLVIADQLGPIALAGVMGGGDTEVSADTKNVLLEAATFDGINVRRTAQRIQLSTEASARFTRGVPPESNLVAGRRAARLLAEHAHARIVPGRVDAYARPFTPNVVYATRSNVERILGIPITKELIVDSLRRLDFTCEIIDAPTGLPAGPGVVGLHASAGEQWIRCTAPWYRLDVQYPADLIEEVARIIGYERVEIRALTDEMPSHPVDMLLATEAEMRATLVGMGLQENINYSVTTPEHHAWLRLDSEAPYVAVTNPISSERTVMRRSMIVSALENLAYNVRFTDRMHVFEIGRVYLPEHQQEGYPLEDRRLCVLMYGARRESSVFADPAASEDQDFFDLKGIVEALLRRLRHSALHVHFEPIANASFGPRCVEVRLDGLAVGLAGEIHPEVRAAFGLPAKRVAVAELHIRPLARPSWELQRLPPISNFPPVMEDLAFTVPDDVAAEALENTIRTAAGPLLKKVMLFDLYQGPPIPEGSKSLAFRLTFQSDSRSLNSQEVAAIREKIVRIVQTNLAGGLRE